ncbi:MAG: DUF2156 domain-containing protein [Deltaproteobacteria bacterium]|nr:DUF2156 domain-containing protein [Deltaproteobacteria bacterium]
MTLKFEAISDRKSLSRLSEYKTRLVQCEKVASDYSFVNLWGWAEDYALSWAWEDDLVWIRQSHPQPAWWAPVGSWQTVDWPALFSKHFPQGSTFIRVPEALLTIWQDAFTDNLRVTETRGQWDYLYAVSDLTKLAGKRFHKKKNLVNQFKKKYDHTYVQIGPETVSQALAMQTDWCLWRDCESSEVLDAENRVIEKILTHWSHLPGLLGGGLMVENRLIAYTVAEALAPDTLVIHFEKGDPDFKGAYQVINQMFLQAQGAPFNLVNREQDLDAPGLRKAKLSYHPTDFLRKYSIEVF